MVCEEEIEMIQKTLKEEIPDTQEALRIYIKAIEQELGKYEPIVRRLKLALKEAGKKYEVSH